MSAVAPHPVLVEGKLDAPLSRWLWLVKWLLAIPHYIILAFLFLAFFLLTIVAFFAILVTGRYPRSLFDFRSAHDVFVTAPGHHIHNGRPVREEREFWLQRCA